MKVAAKAPVGPQLRRTGWLAGEWRKNGLAYLMVLPAFLFMLLVHVWPMLQGIYMSFLKLTQMTLRQFLHAPWVGLQNYKDVLFDTENPIRQGLMLAARNTGIYTVLVTIGVMTTAMIIALLLNRNFRGRSFVRTMMLMPWVVPSYVVGVLWGFMWHQDNGLVNKILVDWLHILSEKPFWLIGPNTMWAIVVPTIWRSWPYVMIIFLAGLQTIPDDLYEAADIDGASPLQKFFKITLPMLKPVIAIQLLFQIIYNVYSYNIVIMMFGNGAGYPGDWGDLFMTALTRNSFSRWLFGYGAAASTVLMLLMLVVVWLWYKVFKQELVIK
ncbi:MAG TPA: sugar ABC transporter permease [Symbiobacteriaceae bacterium]|nr:sugar ABC transporter permease [Symbiobacteriaceae bacterium]